MDKKQQEYFDFMMSKPSGEDNQYSSGGNGGGCLTNIIALCSRNYRLFYGLDMLI